jgi:hypothetical protein
MGAVMKRREVLFLMAALINPFKKVGLIPCRGGYTEGLALLPLYDGCVMPIDKKQAKVIAEGNYEIKVDTLEIKKFNNEIDIKKLNNIMTKIHGAINGKPKN